MAEITVLHNPRCSMSRAALDAAADAGVEVEAVQYLKTPLARQDIVSLIATLDDDPTDLVRRDATFKELGLTDADVATADQVADVLAGHPKLMQRPVLVGAGRAIIGRPKDRVPAFFTQAATA